MCLFEYCLYEVRRHVKARELACNKQHSANHRSRTSLWTCDHPCPECCLNPVAHSIFYIKNLQRMSQSNHLLDEPNDPHVIFRRATHPPRVLSPVLYYRNRQYEHPPGTIRPLYPVFGPDSAFDPYKIPVDDEQLSTERDPVFPLSPIPDNVTMLCGNGHDRDSAKVKAPTSTPSIKTGTVPTEAASKSGAQIPKTKSKQPSSELSQLGEQVGSDAAAFNTAGSPEESGQSKNKTSAKTGCGCGVM